MTARLARAIVSVALLTTVAACATSYEVQIETPIEPKLDVTPFQRVLIAGFVAGGTEDVDANIETVRLLRSQLRTKSDLKVIEAEVLPLAELAAEQAKASDGGVSGDGEQPTHQSVRIRDEKDLEQFERIFANVAFWKKLGEEYQSPLIVTGTVLFMSHSRSGFVTQEREVYDSLGRRSVVPMRTYTERKGFILQPRFVFIDGRTGAIMYSEKFREEILYSAQQNTPALSSYFELMDRLLPSFLSTLSTQRIRGSRVLLK